MFIPRSVARRPKQSPTRSTPFSSNNNVDEVSNTLNKSALQSQRSDPLEALCNNATPTLGSKDTVTAVTRTSPQYDKNEPPWTVKASGPVAQTDTTDSRSGSHEVDSDDSDEPVLSFSKQQRWPAPGEPVCVVCGRYGAYIVDRTDEDICSLECKAKRLMKLGIHLRTSPLDSEAHSDPNEENDDEDSVWVYREHPEVTSMTGAQCSGLYKLVSICTCTY